MMNGRLFGLPFFDFIGNFDFLKDKRNTRSSNVSSINTCVGMTIRRWSDQKI